ncbi:hypothetical protein, partial [Escherichia coli]|uniref:hypothetical protein n=1 Tax=Escherichia coli TaxID=562 RepID=UPI001C59E396
LAILSYFRAFVKKMKNCVFSLIASWPSKKSRETKYIEISRLMYICKIKSLSRLYVALTGHLTYF